MENRKLLNNIEEHYCSPDVHSLLVQKGCRIPIIMQSIWITQSMAIEWVRVNFGIYVESYVDDNETYGYIVSKFSKKGKSNLRHDYPLKRNFKTRVDAVNEALKYTLTNLI